MQKFLYKNILLQVKTDCRKMFRADPILFRLLKYLFKLLIQNLRRSEDALHIFPPYLSMQLSNCLSFFQFLSLFISLVLSLTTTAII